MYPYISREDCYYTDIDSVVLGNPLPKEVITSSVLGGKKPIEYNSGWGGKHFSTWHALSSYRIIIPLSRLSSLQVHTITALITSDLSKGRTRIREDKNLLKGIIREYLPTKKR
ncbi:hypothetical protein ACOSP7_031306 [Xanthoceras sorbifolium]